MTMREEESLETGDIAVPGEVDDLGETESPRDSDADQGRAENDDRSDPELKLLLVRLQEGDMGCEMEPRGE